ncbi:MAG TPA: long-chain fatty acid--CoA ligase [Actinomycetota bacterium]
MTDHRPWFASYPPGVPHSLEPYPEESMFSMLEASARRFPENPALAWFGKHMSYSGLLAEVERCSAMLAGMGVGRGDRVALIMPNAPHYTIAYYATARLGGVITGCNPIYTQREMDHQLRDADPTVVIVADLMYADFAEVFADVGIRNVVVMRLNDYMPLVKKLLAPIAVFKKQQRAAGKPWPPVPKDAPVTRWHVGIRSAGTIPPVATVKPKEDVAGLIYTGGTTGISKGAALSHYNITSNTRQARAWFPTIEDGTDAILGVLPFFHSFGMVAHNLAILKGLKLIPIPNPRDIHMVLESIAKERASLFAGVPRMYIALNENPKTPEYDLKSLKVCVSGAAPLPAAVAEEFERITEGGRLLEGYGLTETSPLASANPFDGVRKPGTIGLPAPDTDFKLVSLDDPETELGVDEPGELCIKGPQVMLGYWQRPEESALMIRNGWLHTGDIAVMDADGYFTIVDRLKDMIIVSGFNVYPTEVEDVLYRNPKISKCAVIGVPDDRTGERVKAYIVLKEGVTATPEEIIAWTKDPEQGLTGYRAPHEIEFRDALPETMIGKVLRRVLQEEERAKRGAGEQPAGRESSGAGAAT